MSSVHRLDDNDRPSYQYCPSGNSLYVSDGFRPVFPDVPWAMPVAKKYEEVNGEWQWEFSGNDLDQIADAEEIRDHMLRAIYGSFSNAKEHSENVKRKLEWVS